jgi:hypothetical protein
MGFWLVKEIQREEGIEGLKDRTKSGRPPDNPEETIWDTKWISIQQTGMDYETGRRSDCQKKWGESDIIIILTYVAFYTSGDSNRRYQNRYM